MECLKSTDAISVLLDLTEPEEERLEVSAHVDGCQSCSDAVNEYRRLRQSVRGLPARRAPAQLTRALIGIASRDRARRVAWLNCRHAFETWRLRTRMTIENMMRPIAVPVAGGIISAILLFATILPDFAYEVHPVRNDVPSGLTVLFTDASVKDASWPVIGDTNIVVDLTIDETGRLTDYSIVCGAALIRDETLRRRFESALLLTQFTPATIFGHPTAGKVRVSFRTSRIDIRG
jgi:hypothetical protein